MSVGDALAQARSQAGLTVAQVSQLTCIRETIIRGIERGDFSACGGDFYARGHIRSIARVVGLDPEELVREYDAVHGAPHAITAADVFEPSTPIKLKEGRRANWSVVLVVVLALAIGYGVFRLVDHGSPSRPVASGGTHPAASKSPTPNPSPTPAAAHPRRLTIRLTAIQDCWIEFTRPHGQPMFQVYVLSGSTRTWHFKHAVTMQIGNPGGITLTVNGKHLGRPGAYGQPVTLNFGPSHPLPSTSTG
ncbi:MAG: helix-turn-helix domain-containing protein [Actinobacteria bacterium]|nr:helix-turn-helix domain-containing protein [Actinomycetota bacterium]